MRALARWGVMPLLAAPLGAWALGFGDIELQSALNQPFQAQIALVATPDELQGLKVALASPEVFERYGVDRPGFLTRFDFKIATSGGRSVVQVTSREPVIEPFVTLLVEATWARGRRLREYTVLLDPPVLLPAPATPPAVSPAQTRPASPSGPGGAINRPAPASESPPERAKPTQQPAPTPPRTEPAPAPRSEEQPKPSRPPPRALPTSAPGGTYGPVRRAETLWSIADRARPEDVSINRMMLAVYRSNPRAFGGNMNVLLAGATLQLPTSSDLEQLTARVANEEVQRQSDAWLNRPQEHTLRLLPPSAETKATPPSQSAQAASSRAPDNAPVTAPSVTSPPASDSASATAEATRRLLEVRDEELRKLQQQAAAPETAPADKPAEQRASEAPAPGVELAPEPLFTDEAKKDDAAQAPAAVAPAATATPTPAPAPAAPTPHPETGPSLVSQVVGWLMTPVLWIGLGVAALLLTALWFVRRRRQEPEDVTGRWEALETEVAGDVEHEQTARSRRKAPEGSIVVEETARRAEPVEESAPERPRASAQRGASAAAPASDETMSTQGVINLDQADPVAEADFHMAYGLYDQAAELVQKALEAAPNRRDLKLKLLEVFFVWGNKDAFLKAAQSLRGEIGQKADPDWDKVVIMGKQICPDERLFAEATAGAGQVDVDLQAGDSPLDLAFDEPGVGEAAGSVDLDLGDTSLQSFDLEPTAERPALKPAAAKPAAPKSRAKDIDAGFDIGEKTAAGLEDALKELDEAGETSGDVSDSLAVTQESPTIEKPRSGRDWSSVSLESPTTEMTSVDDAPTVETPTIRSARPGPPTVERPALGPGGGSETAEIDLDDLGLDVKDLEGLPHDLGDLTTARDGDTRTQRTLASEDDLLSPSGITQVLHDDEDTGVDFDEGTSVLGDHDATMLTPGGDNTMTGTEVLDQRFQVDESGETSLVKALGKGDKERLDLDLDDLTAALHGGATVEQARGNKFKDVFGGGETPVDLDVGVDAIGSDDPTGTEEASPLDPQTMTEVGTKLDLARAYIDMGDPEGARSILEEVLDEGDPNQRREAQNLIEGLST